MKINCPFHYDKTESLELYPDRAYCFGACGKPYTYEQLNKKGIDKKPPNAPKPKTDLRAAVAHIKKLPLKPIRGLELPADDESYYILWQDEKYYKRRFFNRDKPKYIDPSGHEKPLFFANEVERPKGIMIVEGELNALSVAKAYPNYQVISPGSASDFTGKQLLGCLHVIEHYPSIFIIADEDKAGHTAAVKLWAKLKIRNIEPTIRLMKPDANDLLVGNGIEGIQKEIKA